MEFDKLASALMSNPTVADSSGPRDSAEILRRAIAGDRVAFEQVVIRHERRVLMTAFHLLGQLQDAQDAASQEVFLRLYKYLRGFDQNRDLLPWLYRVTVNVCRDINRKRRNLTTSDMEQWDLASFRSDPDADVRRAEQRQMINRALHTLTEKERMALVLRDIEGLSTKEVAGILGSSEATVRVQISTARVKIRKFVDALEKRNV
jgi:RNA polymerase sigma-70 factor (ECF subfamily)